VLEQAFGKARRPTLRQAQDLLATDVALHREHAGYVVQLLADILAKALHLAAAGAGGVLGLVVNIAARQVCRQGFAPGAWLVLVVLVVRALDVDTLDLALRVGDVSVQRVLQQALLLGAETGTELLAGGGELQPLQDRQLVGEFVHQSLLERHLTPLALKQRVLGRHLRHQAQQCLAHLLWVKAVEVLGGNHRE
jgi:hypothetical protein